MADDIWILGANMTEFTTHRDSDAIDLAYRASRGALDDAGVSFDDMQFMTMSTGNAPGSGQVLLRQLGQTGIPVFNVINACATGANAVRACHMAIKAGEADLALAVGVEKTAGAGLLGAGGMRPKHKAEYKPKGRLGGVMNPEGKIGTQTMPGVFSLLSSEYAARWGVTFDQFAMVGEKNHAHSTLNPLAQYRKRFTLDEIKGDEMIAYPNTKLMCCPNADGAAALVLVSGAKLKTLSAEQRRRAVKISASVIRTQPYTEGEHVVMNVNELTQQASKQAYEIAGVDPKDLSLVELHDCFASAELLHYDNLGLCETGGAGEYIQARKPWRDGDGVPVNVSGGLLSKGHPIGATGVAGIYEIATHLRGEAGDRQIEGARVGLAHVLGLGSTCAIHILERAAA